ncbi:cytochrome D1 domain-containing protein [Azospirillum halopraeferens]|uniref:cytochrome D1 domain-containing protein n=1 Tax=Azospirillum halopraeferens TaxID=34010 RepID=UPI00040DA509|nr:cytochrome D1 domain-containing protein [Azospirillum halopraeferens]
MPTTRSVALAALALSAALHLPPAFAAPPDPARLFTEHCAACHGGDRLGAIGPALLPENLGRLKPAEAESIIRHGRPATQMPGFAADVLDDAAVTALAAYVFTPLPAMPVWGEAEITASRILHRDPATLPAAPQHGADPLNLFTVVEAGDHHVSIVDGDRFTVLDRFPSRFALHGGAKYSPDGRFVYLASRDGWIAKYDLHSLALVAEVRAGVNTRNVAVSADGRVLMVGNTLPHTLVALDAGDLNPLAVIPVADAAGNGSRVSAVYAMPPRGAFVAALKDIREVWEIPWGEPGRFPVRRMETADHLDDFFFDPPYRHLMGASRDGRRGIVVDMDAGAMVAELDLPGMPHLGSGISFSHEGRTVMATPHLREAVISVIDTGTWTTLRRIAMPGPGFFLRGHETTPYAWGDAYMGREKDVIPVIDTRTLEIVRTLRPAPGKLTAHVEFTRDGRHALVSVMEDEGALVVYDAATFAEVARLPMRKPIGKYNVWNKISYSSGTSH